jgi:hypothetical protein
MQRPQSRNPVAGLPAPFGQAGRRRCRGDGQIDAVKHRLVAECLAQSGSAEANAALSRQGRYKTVAGNMQVKEVRLPESGDRFIICLNPGQAVRDATIRASQISALEELIAGSG